MSLLFSREVPLDINKSDYTHCISCSFQINNQNLSWICSCISSICVNNRMWHKLDYQNENTAVSFKENCIIVLQEHSTIATCWHCHRKGHLPYKGQSLAKSQKFFNAANDVFAAIAVTQLYMCSPSKHHSLHPQSISYIHASLFPSYSECPLPPPSIWHLVQLIVLRAL